MTSFNLNFFLLSLSSNSATLGVRASTYTFCKIQASISCHLPILNLPLPQSSIPQSMKALAVNSGPLVMLRAPFSKSTLGLIMFHLLPTCLSIKAYCSRLLTDFPASTYACPQRILHKQKSDHFTFLPTAFRAFHVAWKESQHSELWLSDLTWCMRLPTEAYFLPLFIVLLPSTYINPLMSVQLLLPLPLHLFLPLSGMFFPWLCAWYTTFIPGLCKQCLLLLPCLHPLFRSQPPAASTT